LRVTLVVISKVTRGERDVTESIRSAQPRISGLPWSKRGGGRAAGAHAARSCRPVARRKGMHAALPPQMAAIRVGRPLPADGPFPARPAIFLGVPLATWQQPVIGQCMVAVVVAVVVPLCLLRVVAGSLPAFVAVGAAKTTGWADGLALPLLAVVAPLAGLAVRRFRAWPVVLGGLAGIGLGDVLAGLGAPAAAAAAHGTGAGLAVPATLALATEAAGRPRRLLAAWWVVIAVTALALLPGLERYGLVAHGSRAPLGPGPWLSAVAIAAVLLHVALSKSAAGARTGGTRVAGTRAEDRAAFPAAERAQLAMLAVPAAALGLIALAVACRPHHAAAAAAAAEAVGLFVIVAMTVRGPASRGFAVACAALGFIVAPASGALGSLWAMAHASGHEDGGLLAVAAVLGAVGGAIAVAWERQRGTRGRPGRQRPRRHEGHRKGETGRWHVLIGPAGLLLAAAALVAACFAGPFAAGPVLAVLVAALTGGLAAAVAGPVLDATTAGAMAGVAICVVGAEVGYLGQGAIQVRLAGTASLPAAAAPWALVTALGWWELAGAAVALTIAVIRCFRLARTGTCDGPRSRPRVEPCAGRGSDQARSVHG
jgi:hypothetical protein